MAVGLSEEPAPGGPGWRRPEPEYAAQLRRRDFLNELDERLAQPPLKLSVDEFVATIEYDEIKLLASIPNVVEDQPDLPIRLRGALGRALAELGAPDRGRFDPFGRPAAFDILYQSIGKRSALAHVATPMVVQCDRKGHLLSITVRLFGSAGYWWSDVVEALQLLSERGVSAHNFNRQRFALDVHSITHDRIFGLDPVPTSASALHLRLLSPLRLRSRDATLFDAASIMIAAANRAARLSPWLDATLCLDWGEVHRLANTVAVINEDLVGIRWDRGSRRSGARVPALGLIGTIVLQGNLGPLLPFILCAEKWHCGSHASLGFGRLQVTAYP